MILRIALAVVVLTFGAPRVSSAETGILLLAHGGGPQWNTRVNELAATVNKSKPTEVAFGMATRANLQAGIDRLAARGVTEIVAVPLFVSSWSSVITSTEYLLGLRAEAPADLAMFARMNHGAGGHGAGGHAAHDAHAGHGAAPKQDGTMPVTSRVPIRMTRALNDHPVVAEILVSRAAAVGKDPSSEALVIVAHGPNEEEENQKWLADMRSLAQQVSSSRNYASVDYLTVRDDAPKPVWEKARAELRGIVERSTAAGHRVVVVPLLISFGGIEKGLRERLDGLTYTMAESGLMPDDRLAAWVLQMAEKR